MPNIFSLPREGITLEYLCRPLTAVLLQPILTGAALFASIRYPAQTEKVIFNVFSGAVSSSALIKPLKYLFALGILYRLHRWSNRLADNNFTSDPKWNWEKEIVLVTGASSGIGALMVEQFAKRNITVVALDVRPPTTALPSNAKFYKADVSSFEDIHETAERIRKEVGNPTVLINNAGVAAGNTILDEPEEDIRRVFNVNIVSHFGMIKEFLPYMVQHDHGHIVTVASLASFMVNASNVDYACTKAAALAFHEGLSLELRHMYKAKRVRTTVVHPSWIRTPLVQRLIENYRAPKGLIMEGETVADAVVSQVLSTEGAQLVLPPRLSVLACIRAFPNWLQHWIRNTDPNLLIFSEPKVKK